MSDANIPALARKLKGLQQQVADAEKRQDAGEDVDQSYLDKLHGEVAAVMKQVQDALKEKQSREKGQQKTVAETPGASKAQSNAGKESEVAKVAFSAAAGVIKAAEGAAATKAVEGGVATSPPASIEAAVTPAPPMVPMPPMDPAIPTGLLAPASAPAPTSEATGSLQPEAAAAGGKRSLLASRIAAARQQGVPTAMDPTFVENGPSQKRPGEELLWDEAQKYARSDQGQVPIVPSPIVVPDLASVDPHGPRLTIEEEAAAELMDIQIVNGDPEATLLMDSKSLGTPQAAAAAQLLGVPAPQAQTTDASTLQFLAEQQQAGVAQGLDPDSIKLQQTLYLEYMQTMQQLQLIEKIQLEQDPLNTIGAIQQTKITCTKDELQSQKLAMHAAQQAAKSAASEHKGFVGLFAKYDLQKNFGFIKCDETYAIYERDIFLRKQHFVGVDVGDTVFFQIEIGDRGHPQAKNVRRLREITRQRHVLQNMQEGYCTAQQIEHGNAKGFGEMVIGTVRVWKDTWGFIICPEAFKGDIFAHRANFSFPMGPPRDLTGWKVKFQQGTDANGKRTAVHCSLVEPPAGIIDASDVTGSAVASALRATRYVAAVEKAAEIQPEGHKGLQNALRATPLAGTPLI